MAKFDEMEQDEREEWFAEIVPPLWAGITIDAKSEQEIKDFLFEVADVLGIMR